MALGNSSAYAYYCDIEKFAAARLGKFLGLAEINELDKLRNAPWLLEDRLRISGARYIAKAPWTPHALVDGNLLDLCHRTFIRVCTVAFERPGS